MGPTLRAAREAWERNFLIEQLGRYPSVTATAKEIGMERSALQRKLRDLGIRGHGKQEEFVA